jgi:hypothetical protein
MVYWVAHGLPTLLVKTINKNPWFDAHKPFWTSLFMQKSLNEPHVSKTYGKVGSFPVLTNLLPSGKRSHNYGKSPFLMGKSTINGHFQKLFWHNQSVFLWTWVESCHFSIQRIIQAMVVPHGQLFGTGRLIVAVLVGVNVGKAILQSECRSMAGWTDRDR